MRKSNQDCLTDRHLLLFGTIIHWFARYELLMQNMMAAVARTDAASVMLLTRGLDFSGKLRALLDLLRHKTIPLDQFDRISELLMIPHTLTLLRNDIAHSGWIPHKIGNWIQPDWILHFPPSVKPLRADLNVPTPTFTELDQDKVGYSVDELSEVASRLAATYAQLSDYVREIHLIDPGNDS